MNNTMARLLQLPTKFSRLLIALMPAITALPAYGHSGHGAINPLLHIMDHALWYTGSVILITICIIILHRKKHND